MDKETLENGHPPLTKPMSDQVCYLDRLILGRSHIFLFSRVIYDEVHRLLCLLLDAGYLDVCKQYCQIGSSTISVINHEKERRWFTQEQEEYKEITPDEAKILQNANSISKKSTWIEFAHKFLDRFSNCVSRRYTFKKKNPQKTVFQQTESDVKDGRLFSLPSVDMLEQYHIISCTLAESVNQAYITSNALGCNNTQDTAIVWWYFEYALLYWNTPASCSDQGDTWKEIATAKDPDCSIEPTIFTSQFFKQGIRTLTNEITAYFSKFATEEAVQKSIKDEISFELTFGDNDALDPNKDAKNGSLWISITTCETPTQYFYLKKFNYDSSPWRFAATLLRKYSKGGIVEVELGSAESISKFIERIGLDGDIREIFFGRSEGNRVPFRGKCVTLKRCAIDNLDDILELLLQKHNEAGAPQFPCF